jgi:hypothetical protein
MNTITRVFITFILMLCISNINSQEQNYTSEIAKLKSQRELVEKQEKEALKLEVAEIDERLQRGEISAEEAKDLKSAAAKKRALNIENRQRIIDNRIALLERNGEDTLTLSDTLSYKTRIRVGWGQEEDDMRVFGIRFDENWKERPVKYDRRTYSDLVVAVGLNNAIIEGSSLSDSPYKIGGSRFFELGWVWRTRVFKNSNFMRLNYGFSFQFNGLKPEGNQYFVSENGQTELQDFEFDLKKSKFRMDNLVFPVHLEFGPSKRRDYSDKFRYSLRNQFRIGFGGYGGFNLGTRQKLKYNRNGESVKDKLKRGYNASDLIYGLSAYIGVDGVLLYAKYDLNPIFKDALVEQRNVSLGLRFDL